MERDEALIKRHEGYRDRVYKDTVGILTVGWGHALQAGSPIPAAASEALFADDYRKAKLALAGLVADGLVPADLCEARRAVLVNMAFNLGVAGLRKFGRTLEAIRRGDFVAASEAMKDSLWARQVKSRADDLSAMMETGEFPSYLK